MPFTGSHPAAVLPLLGTPLPASALVIGSAAPDLPYYLPVRLGWPTHSLVGVLTVDVLLGALAYALWHGVLCAPALAASPAGLRARVEGRAVVGLRRRLRTAREAGLVLAALAVGAATHVAWDAFTHPGRWGSDVVPALAATWGPAPGHQWMQHASSALGAALLLAWAVRWWRRTPPRRVPAGTALVWAWPALLLVGTATGLAAALAAPPERGLGFVGATRGGAAAAALALALAVAWHAWHARRAGRDGGTGRLAP